MKSGRGQEKIKPLVLLPTDLEAALARSDIRSRDIDEQFKLAVIRLGDSVGKIAKVSKKDGGSNKMTPLNKLALKLRTQPKSWAEIRRNDEVKTLIQKEDPEYKDLDRQGKQKFWNNVRRWVNKALRKQ